MPLPPRPAPQRQSKEAFKDTAALRAEEKTAEWFHQSRFYSKTRIRRNRRGKDEGNNVDLTALSDSCLPHFLYLTCFTKETCYGFGINEQEQMERVNPFARLVWFPASEGIYQTEI